MKRDTENRKRMIKRGKQKLIKRQQKKDNQILKVGQGSGGNNQTWI